MKKQIIKTKEQRLSFHGKPATLCFHGDELVDWANGDVYPLSGAEEYSLGYRISYDFDAAVASPCGRYAVIYNQLGTKGLLMKQGEILRELNRSFYQAQAYEYPVTLFRLPDGRDVLAHCPDEYDRIEIEEVESGKRLTASELRKPVDFFQSRLAASPDGRYLMSAGWVWHPVDMLQVFDVSAALLDPTVLDGAGLFPLNTDYEGFNACFMGDGRLVICAGTREYDPHTEVTEDKDTLEIVDFRRSPLASILPIEQYPGAMMPVGEHHVLGLCGTPRLFDLHTGAVVQEWPDINIRIAASAIRQGWIQPTYVFDAAGLRCAVVQEKDIAVLQFEVESSNSD